MTGSALDVRGRPAVRWLFVALLLFFVAQEVLTLANNREPYPALFQPSFGNGSVTPEHTVVGDEATMRVVFADGSTGTYDALQVHAEAKSSPLTTFRSTFGPTSPRRDRPQTVAWLESRLRDLSGGKQPVSAELVWHKVAYHLDDDKGPDMSVIDTHAYAFGGRDG